MKHSIFFLTILVSLLSFNGFGQTSEPVEISGSKYLWGPDSDTLLRIDTAASGLRFIYPGNTGDFVIGAGDDFIFVQQSEKQPFRMDWSAYKFTVPLAFVAGFADGFNQTLNFHYDKFKKVFPRANNQFWNPRISWENKYAIDPNGNVNTNYEAFPGSTTIFVFATDGHHLTRFFDHSAMMFCVALNIHDIGRKNWKQIAADAGAVAVGRGLGFAMSYKWIFRKQ